MTLDWFNLKYTPIASYGRRYADNVFGADDSCTYNDSNDSPRLSKRIPDKRVAEERIGRPIPAHNLDRCRWLRRGIGAFFIYKAEQRERKSDRIREHYRRLIDDSFSKWSYYPESSGDSITFWVPDKFDPRAGSHKQPVPYLKQCLEHLRGYENLWTLYQDGAELAKQLQKANEEHTKHYKEIEDIVREKTKDTRFMYPTTDEVIKGLADKISHAIDSEFKHKRSENFIAEETTDPKEYKIKGTVFGDKEQTCKLADILNEIKNGDIGQKLASDIKLDVEIQHQINSNIEQFRELFRIEIVEKGESTGYTYMKGTCDDCRYLLR